MTEAQFRAKYSKPDGFNRVLNYSMCVVLLAFGSGAVFVTVTHPAPNVGSTLIAVLFSTMLIAVSAYGFWRIPRDYYVWEIMVPYSNDNLKARIRTFLEVNRFKDVRTSDNMTRAYYQRFLLGSGVEIAMLINDQKIVYNIRLYQDHGRYERGFIDMGAVESLRKKLEAYVNA